MHPGTASRALNEETRALVNEETARRVLEAAEELGYRPNPIARGLKTNRSYTIGVLIPDLTNPLFPPILRGIEDRLEESGYTPLMANTDNDPERERIDWHAMRARQVDGIVAATARRDHELLDELHRGRHPGGAREPPRPGRAASPRRRPTTARASAWRSSTSPSSGTRASPTSPARSSCRRGSTATRAFTRRCASSASSPTPSSSS